MIYWIRTNRQGGNLHHNDQEGMFDTELINWQDDIDVEIVIINDNWFSPWWSGRFLKIAKRDLEVCANSVSQKLAFVISLTKLVAENGAMEHKGMLKWVVWGCWGRGGKFYALAFWCHQWRQQEINWQASASNKTREITDGKYGILTEWGTGNPIGWG